MEYHPLQLLSTSPAFSFFSSLLVLQSTHRCPHPTRGSSLPLSHTRTHSTQTEQESCCHDLHDVKTPIGPFWRFSPPCAWAPNPGYDGAMIPEPTVDSDILQLFPSGCIIHSREATFIWYGLPRILQSRTCTSKRDNRGGGGAAPEKDSGNVNLIMFYMTVWVCM